MSMSVRLLAVRTRGWPLVARWAGTSALVGLAWSTRYLLFGQTGEEALLLFLSVVIVAAIFFGRGSGFLATCLGAPLAIYIAPVDRVTIERLADVLDLVMFCSIGLLLSGIIGSLHKAHARLEMAHDREVAEQRRVAADKRERELLLAGLRHCVRNELQRVSAIMHLQAKRASSETAQALLKASNRIQQVERLHSRLARQDEDSVVDVPQFLGEILDDIRPGMDEPQRVGLLLAAEPLLLPMAKAGSLGLITNELVTNALKHAFPDAEHEWIVKVMLHREGDDATLTVEDNGRGMPKRVRGIGIGLVRAMIGQMDGCIETTTGTNGGALHVLRFPVESGAISTSRPMVVYVGHSRSISEIANN